MFRAAFAAQGRSISYPHRKLAVTDVGLDVLIHEQHQYLKS